VGVTCCEAVGFVLLSPAFEVKHEVVNDSHLTRFDEMCHLSRGEQLWAHRQRLNHSRLIKPHLLFGGTHNHHSDECNTQERGERKGIEYAL
jgi:hypothetical protein